MKPADALRLLAQGAVAVLEFWMGDMVASNGRRGLHQSRGEYGIG